MTVMSRLAEKGLLERRKDGAAYVYTPAATKEEFTRRTVGTVLSELLDDFTAPAMSQFVELVDEQDEAAIEALARAIEEKRGRAGSDV
jgi:predicted transcriptional regulator